MRTNKHPVEPLNSLKRWLLPSLVLSGRKVPWQVHSKINQHASDLGHMSVHALPGDGRAPAPTPVRAGMDFGASVATYKYGIGSG